MALSQGLPSSVSPLVASQQPTTNNQIMSDDGGHQLSMAQSDLRGCSVHAERERNALSSYEKCIVHIAGEGPIAVHVEAQANPR